MDKHIAAVADAERLEAAARAAYHEAAEAYHRAAARVCAFEADPAAMHSLRVHEEQLVADDAMTLAGWAWDVAIKRLAAARRASRKAAA